MRRSWIPLLFVLTACATNIPEAIREPPPDDVPLADVLANPDAHNGRHVRWGGTVAGIENGKTETRVEFVARELDRDGRPRPTHRSAGRFIVRVDGFLDPAVYRNGREVTVAGTLDGSTTRKIGEYGYRYPVVKAETIYLWEPRVEPPRYRDPYYYDPFWGPWGPFGPFRPYPYYPWR